MSPFTAPSRHGRSRRAQAAAFVLLLAAVLYAARFWLRSVRFDPSGTRVACPVLSVTDGDTLRVQYGIREERIRMLRINTPERGQPGARQATALLRDWVQGKTVDLEFEVPGQEERDAYGRLLAYV